MKRKNLLGSRLRVVLMSWIVLLSWSLPACQPTSPAPSAEATAQTFTCPMHPSIRQDHPGKCPLCGMDLQPLPSSGTSTTSSSSSAGSGSSASSSSSAGSGSSSPQGESHASAFTCPMHPSIRQDHPGKCPLCGMALQPLTSEPGGDPSQVVQLDPTLLHRIGLSTTPATPRALTTGLRVPGRLELDERRRKRVSARLMGRIDKLYADTTGMTVQAGQPLLELYSPMFLTLQQEYLVARRADPNSAVTRAAQRRLERLGMTLPQLQRLQEQDQPQETLTVVAPSRGTVLEKMALEGAYVEEGMPLFELADLASLWVLASVYERELMRVKVGDAAELRLPSQPAQPLSSRVEFIQPLLDPETSTAQVRLSLSNPTGLLRPGMSVDVLLRSSQPPVLSVPTTALVRTGPEALVFVKVKEETFQPRRVTLGLEQDGYVQVLAGLHEGEPVVSSGAFLLDAQTQITGGQSLLYSAATELSPNPPPTPASAPAAAPASAPAAAPASRRGGQP